MVTMNRKPHSATARLKQDYLRLKKDPVPYVVAEPVPSNILVWHYVVKGPENTPYEGGFYHGKLVFPGEFPFQPPSIFMTTPNGRFKVNTRLCLSISDFHPDTWNPTWSVSTILTGLLSFMVSINGIARIRWLAVSIDSPPLLILDSIILCSGLPLVSRTTPWSSYGYDSSSLHFKLVIPEIEKSPTLGSINTTDSEKRKWALQSLDFNLKDKMFCELFPETVEEIHTELGRREEMQKQTRHQSTTAEVSSLIRDQLQREQSLFNSAMTNLCVILGLAAFAYSVKYVLWSIAME